MFCTTPCYAKRKDLTYSVSSVLFICCDQTKEQGLSDVTMLLDSQVYIKVKSKVESIKCP